MKVSELEGELLDYWMHKVFGRGSSDFRVPPYSTNWEIGGPIMEEMQISLNSPLELVPSNCGHNGYAPQEFWTATTRLKPRARGAGPTMLIAGMRCIVEGAYGEEVPD